MTYKSSAASNVAITSRQAYRELTASGDRERQAQKVALRIIEYNKQGINPNIRMIAETLSIQRSSVSARFSEIRKKSEDGKLFVGGVEYQFDMMPMQKCPYSKRITERWALIKRAAKVQPTQLQLF